MKKSTKLSICILLVIVSLLSFSACDDKPQAKQLTSLTLPELADNQIAVIIKKGDSDYQQYVVELEKLGTGANTCEQAIEYLQNKAKLAVTWQDGTYGKYLTAIGGIAEGDGQYVFVYTTNPNFQGTWAGVSSYVIGDGVLLKEAAVGVSDLQVQAGDVIYFELGSYNY